MSTVDFFFQIPVIAVHLLKIFQCSNSSATVSLFEEEEEETYLNLKSILTFIFYYLNDGKFMFI